MEIAQLKPEVMAEMAEADQGTRWRRSIKIAEVDRGTSIEGGGGQRHSGGG